MCWRLISAATSYPSSEAKAVKRVLRIVIRVVILSIVVLFAILAFQNRPAGDVGRRTTVVEDAITVEKGDLTVTVSATGALQPARQIALSFEFSAPVREILVETGQTVTAGQVLARLDTGDLEAAVTNAEIALSAQQVAYQSLIAPPREVDIAVAQAALTAAQAQAGAVSLGADSNQQEIARLQTELARNQLWQAQLSRDAAAQSSNQLLEQAQAMGFNANQQPIDPADHVTSTISQAEYGVALADVSESGVVNQGPDVSGLSSANAAIVSAQVQLDRLLNGPSDIEVQIAETQVALAEVAVAQAEAALNRTVLTAPFDGVVAETNLTVGELPPQTAAIQVVDASTYFVDVAVDETDVVKVQVGQSVTIMLDALPDEKLTGQVTRVAVAPIRAGQLVTYTVRVMLDPAQVAVRAGMTATSTIVVNALKDVVILPNRFIRIDRATAQAYATVESSSGVYEDVPVVLGVRNETESQIISGLEADQQVVLIPRSSFDPIASGGP
jgi:HlyD family secretion protein